MRICLKFWVCVTFDSLPVNCQHKRVPDHLWIETTQSARSSCRTLCVYSPWARTDPALHRPWRVCRAQREQAPPRRRPPETRSTTRPTRRLPSGNQPSEIRTCVISGSWILSVIQSNKPRWPDALSALLQLSGEGEDLWSSPRKNDGTVVLHVRAKLVTRTWHDDTFSLAVWSCFTKWSCNFEVILGGKFKWPIGGRFAEMAYFSSSKALCNESYKQGKLQASQAPAK